MNDLDEKSQAFIEWSMQKLSEDYGYANLADRIVNDLQEWYDSHGAKEFRPLLQAKMIEGAKEHGEPKENPDSIQKEINNEAIDLIGWSLMLEYAKSDTTTKKSS